MPATPNFVQAMVGGFAYYSVPAGTILAATAYPIVLPGAGASQKQAAMWGCYNDSAGAVYISWGSDNRGLGGIGVSGRPAGAQAGGVIQLECAGGITQFSLYSAGAVSLNGTAPGGVYFWVFTRN